MKIIGINNELYILECHTKMKTIGTFKIESSFNVSGRGIIAVGQIIEGIPKLGNFISKDISGKQEIIKIIGIERGSSNDNNIIRHGLFLYIDNPIRIKYIAENKLTEQIVEILHKD
jgi:hypothetical protein